MWYNVLIDSAQFPPTLIRLLFRYRHRVKSFTCSSTEENRLCKPLNRVLRDFSNLVYLNVSGCPLIYYLDFVQFTPNVTELNVSDCQNMSTASMINNLHLLGRLEIFKCNDNMVHVSAYSVYQAVEGLDNVKFISCTHSGNMQPWIVRGISSRCPKLTKFLFTTFFALATERSMYEWYTIVRNTHAHIEFPQRILQEVSDFERSSARVQQELKKNKTAIQLDKWQQDFLY